MVKYTTQKLFSLPLHKTVSQPTAGSLVLTNYGVRWSWNTETAAPTVQQCSARTQDTSHFSNVAMQIGAADDYQRSFF